MLKRGVLFPMWDLLDDMAALKVLEFARARDLSVLNMINQMNNEEDGGRASVVKSQIFDHASSFAERCMDCFLNRYKKCCGSTRKAEPEEIVQLKVAFQSMRQAMRSWAKYVPTSLVKRLVMADQEAQLGVSKHDVTVMFIDIADFHDVCRGKSPTHVLQLLCEVQEVVAEEIEVCHGTLLEMIGDEVLTIFNAPLPVRNHASLAVSTGIRILEAVKKASPNTQLRCGIHRAEVLTGNIGSKKRMKYGILGDGVNIAARLKSLNSQFNSKILTTEHTLAEEDMNDGGEVLCRPAGHFILKGRLHATHIWEVVGLRSAEKPPIATAIDLHKQAFMLYLNRHFSAARSLLTEVHASLCARNSWGDDLISGRLISRCEDFIENEPPAIGMVRSSSSRSEAIFI
jgi:adenylate cyclase